MRRGRELSRNERLDRRRRLLEMHALDERLKVVLFDLSITWRGVGLGGTTPAHRHKTTNVLRVALCEACVSVVPMEAAIAGYMPVEHARSRQP